MMTKKSSSAELSQVKQTRQRAVAALDKPGKQFGLKLARLRAEHQLTMSEIGRRVGITESAVNNLEKGFYVPQPGVVLRLAEVYGVRADQLLALRCRCLVTRFEQKVAREHEAALAEWKTQGAFSFPK